MHLTLFLRRCAREEVTDAATRRGRVSTYTFEVGENRPIRKCQGRGKLLEMPDIRKPNDDTVRGSTDIETLRNRLDEGEYRRQAR